MVLQFPLIPTCNLWSVDQYKTKLASIGYGDDIKVQLVGDQVFKGWQGTQCQLQIIDNAIKPKNELKALLEAQTTYFGVNYSLSRGYGE